MALETGTYIDSLVTTNPVGASDPKSQGDDHIRLLKTTIKNTFPNITGAMNATQAELNVLAGAATFMKNFLADGTRSAAHAELFAKGSDVAAAGTIVVPVDGFLSDVTGNSVTVTAFTVPAGRVFALQFDGRITLTHNATTLILPGSTNLKTEPGDVLFGFAHAADQVTVIQYLTRRRAGILPGEIRLYGAAAAPFGWLLCDGTAYNAATDASYQALYDVIGNTFGGTDNTDFQVPDLRGRSPIGVGTGDATEATAWTLGEKPTSGVGGEEKHAQTVAEMAQHGNHSSSTVTVAGAAGSALVGLGSGQNWSANKGSGDAANITHPVLGLNFIISK